MLALPKPDLGFATQELENVSLRNFVFAGASPEQKKRTGVLITAVAPLGSCAGLVLKGDVLLAIDNVSIADDSSVPFRGQERLAYPYLISNKQRCGRERGAHVNAPK